MKQPIDINKLDDKQKDLFNDFLLNIAENGFQREDFDYKRWQMDCALKQEFIDESLWRESYRDYGLDATQIQELTGVDLEEIESPNKPDEYSSLYLPLLLKGFRAYLVNMSNLSFPANGDWLNLQRGFSEYFYDTGLEKFLPFVNDCWTDIVKTENQRFKFKTRYKTNMAEVISYGNSAVGHFYNTADHVVEPFVPGIGRCGIYPITDDWRKSNVVMYYDVNYQDLLGRVDFDEELIESIRPQTANDDSRVMQAVGSTRMKRHNQSSVPYGKVRLHDFFCPSVYLEGDNNEAFVARNVYVTALIKPFFDESKRQERETVYILKVTQNVSPADHGLLFGSFNTTMPGVFYTAGALMPFLPHQYTANQFISGASRTAGLMIDPPKSAEGSPGSMIDNFETDMPAFEPGSIYKDMTIKPLVDASFANSLQVFLSYIEYLEKAVEEGIGISKGQAGTMHQGRKTATEIKESYSGSQLNIVEAAANYDEQFLRPSISIRITATQELLEEQIRKGVIALLEGDEGLGITEEQAYEQVLSTNGLFRRLLNYSGIQGYYAQFYKKVQAERLADFKILQEVEAMAQQIVGLYDLADSPIDMQPEEDLLKTIAMTLVPPKEGEDGQLIEPKITEQLIQQAFQVYLQQEQTRRAQAKQEAQGLELEMKVKELTFSDTKEVPPPNLKLFYEMLIAPISDSDVIVTGSMTTISKELARQNLLMFLESIGAFPPETLAKMDFDGVLMMLARANDVPLRDLLKDQSQIMREEQEAKQAAQFQQQLIMRTAEGTPGAQPPQMG